MTDTEPAEVVTAAVRADGSAAVSPEERESRLLMLAEALLDGGLHRQLVETAMQTWNVSRRTAQVYVQEAEERLHADARHLPPVFALELSQMQRNRFLHGLVRRAGRNDELSPRDYCTLLATANRLLDSRDRSAARVLEHQARHKTAQADALLSDLKSQMRELADSDKTWREQWQARTQPQSPARLDPPDPPTPIGPSGEEADDGDPDEIIDESQFSEEEKEELRLLRSCHDYQPTPEELAQWRAEAVQIAATLGLHKDSQRPPKIASNPKNDLAAVVPAASPGSFHNAMRREELRAARQRRRQERKRLRRLRKRKRGGG